MQHQEFIHYLQHEKRYSRHTCEAYGRDLHQFSVYLEEEFAVCEAENIEAFHIRAWMMQLVGEGRSPRTINRKVSALKRFFAFLRKRKQLEVDPLQKVLTPKEGMRLPAFVREQEMDLLWEEVTFPEDWSGLRDRAILELLYGTGIRRGELLQLQDTDVNLKTGRLKVRGKGGKERILPLSPDLITLIDRYIRARNKQFGTDRGTALWVGQKGGAAYPNLIYRIVRKYLGQVTTIAQCSPHLLRHTFATHLSNAGAPLNAIKELLGHSSLAATQLYMHNSIERLKQVYQQAHPKGEEE